LAWGLKPKASSLTSVAIATEAGQIGRFLIQRNGPTDSPLTVTFSLTGQAINGVDYQTVPTSVILGTLQASAEIEIVPIADGNPEGNESVILTVTSNNAYVVGPTGTQVTITDSLAGDFNGDGALGLADIDLLVENIAVGPPNPATFDLTADGLVNADDVTQWRALAGALNLPSGNPYLLGDANLDGAVDGSDYNIWNSFKFTNSPAWSKADFNFDGSVDGQDYNIWNSNKFTSANRPAVPQFDFSKLTGGRERNLRTRFHAIDLVLRTWNQDPDESVNCQRRVQF
jgi:hypothetical protein